MALRTFLRFTLVSLIVITHYRIHAQTAFTTGYYQISAGLYTECCGIAGNDFSYELPDENQQFVELIIDPGGTNARLTFLRPDMFTVFRSPQEPFQPFPGFPFSFVNGMVFSNYIRFLSSAPLPEWNSWSYTVTKVADRLAIIATAVRAPNGSDVPNQFEHANV